MPLFKYTAVDINGKRVIDTIEAGSRIEALRKLRQLNLIPLEIVEIQAEPEQREKSKGEKKSPCKWK